MSNFGIATRSLKLLLPLVTIAVVAASCGDGGEETVRGLLMDVQARSITEVETMTMEEQGTGRVWTFQTEGPIGFTPSHLREHMLRGEPVTVHYKERGGRLNAVLVTD